ncbi:helix-turn-helix transcriptional regulator [Cupriavidus sp. KB_39]|jgi:predicted DNA-binding transcriptional regulator YafY|uniref:helix-turn-helix transcriptional regulator n=1 Tax=Cupriavidus sp. KB_39 TaxID=3233036 RepID=UPI003F902B29
MPKREAKPTGKQSQRASGSSEPKRRAAKISIERFGKIIQLLRKRGPVPMATLTKELEISVASVKRDIEFLKNRFGCHIEWSATERGRGYVIRDDLAEGGRFELPGIWFSSAEILALLTMLHLLEGIQPGLLDEDVAPLRNRLRAMLAQGAAASPHIEERIKLIHFAPRAIEPEHFRRVACAVLEGKRVALTYWNRDKQELTERVASPQQMVHYRENWLLDVWCHQRNALRTFALEAIREITVLPTAAERVSREDLRAHFESGYGIFAGPAKHRARIKFTAKRAQWVAAERWHPDQTSVTTSDGDYILEVPYSNDQELVMDLLRHCPEVEVLDPPELREHLHAALCAAAEKNRPPTDH